MDTSCKKCNKIKDDSEPIILLSECSHAVCIGCMSKQYVGAAP